MSKELLTAILDACTDFHTFLTVDLQRERLVAGVEGRRQQLILSTNDIITNIRSSHVSVRPRLYTPNDGQLPPAIGKKPAPKPPVPAPEEVQEMYIACEGETEQPEDYLTFTSQSPEGDDDPQQNYETMTDDPLDTYEEPVQGVISPPSSSHLTPSEDVPQELYEEPIPSPTPRSSGPTPTPPPSAENSGSGAVYARANIQQVATLGTVNETATEWIYDTAKKEEKMKVSQLQNVACKGNLEKLGGKNKKTWQLRHCVLSGPFMYFYEKQSSKTFRNRITLPMYVAEEAPEHTNAKKGHFAFKLTHTDKTGKKKDYFFRSSKQESCQTWLHSIRTVNERTTINSNSQQVAVAKPHVAAGQNGVDAQQEMYEPIDPIDEMTLSEEEAEGDQEDYVDVQPAPLDQAEYTDVPSQLEDDIQEEYEDTTQFISEPPPIPPPSSSSSSSRKGRKKR
jgi:hypothetical protein